MTEIKKEDAPVNETVNAPEKEKKTEDIKEKTIDFNSLFDEVKKEISEMKKEATQEAKEEIKKEYFSKEDVENMIKQSLKKYDEQKEKLVEKEEKPKRNSVINTNPYKKPDVEKLSLEKIEDMTDLQKYEIFKQSLKR
jgi:type IV secretory pathway VirD2 relaxase